MKWCSFCFFEKIKPKSLKGVNFENSNQMKIHCIRSKTTFFYFEKNLANIIIILKDNNKYNH